MTFVLRSFKLILFLTVNLFFLLFGLAVTAAALSTARGIKVKAFCSMLWAKANCSILGLSISVEGHNNSSLFGFIVSNHISYLDIIALGSIRPSVFVSKHEVKDWPLLGWLARMGGTIFIDRSSKKAALNVLNQMEKVIRRGIYIVLFPEGTTSNGYTIKEFKSTLFDLPAKINVPVMPVSLKYTSIDRKPIKSKNAMDTIAWYGDMKLLPHVWKVFGYKRIEAKLFFNPLISEALKQSEASGGSRKLISSLSYESIKKGLNEIRPYSSS